MILFNFCFAAVSAEFFSSMSQKGFAEWNLLKNIRISMRVLILSLLKTDSVLFTLQFLMISFSSSNLFLASDWVKSFIKLFKCSWASLHILWRKSACRRVFNELIISKFIFLRSTSCSLMSRLSLLRLSFLSASLTPIMLLIVSITYQAATLTECLMMQCTYNHTPHWNILICYSWDLLTQSVYYRPYEYSHLKNLFSLWGFEGML